MFRSIRTKIMVLQIGLVLSVAISLGVITYLITFSSLRDSQKQNLEYLAKHISEQLSVAINNKGQLLEKIATSEMVENYFKKPMDSLLAEYFSKYSQDFAMLSYADDEGTEEVKVLNGRMGTKLFNVSNMSVFQFAARNPNKVFSTYSAACPDTGASCVEYGYFNKNFFDENIGFISGRVPIAELIKTIHDFKEAKDNFAMLVDSDGTVLFCPDESKMLKKLDIKGKGSERILSQIKTTAAGYGRVTISGTDSYIAYVPIEGQNWSVVAVLPYEIFSLKLNALRNTVILVGLTILIVGITSSMFVASDITRPILELLQTTSVIATGDFSRRVNIESKDEMGELAAAFNQMTENLQKTTTSMVNLNREILERQKAENAQQGLNEQLEKSINNLTIVNRELAEFAHVAAHDLKAPLRAIGSLAGIIHSDYGDKLDEKGKNYLNTLIKRTERMSELISGILTYSELGRESEITPVNLNEIIRETITGLNVPQNIEISLESYFPTLLCSRTHIQQIFHNLLSNAVKFMNKSKGHVRIKCVENGDNWIFSVSDNGCGIEEKYFEKIFQIFQTLVRRDAEENTGIGLSVVKRIVEKYNGKIWVESQPEIGSTFFFTIRKEKTEVNNEKLQTNSIS